MIEIKTKSVKMKTKKGFIKCYYLFTVKMFQPKLLIKVNQLNLNLFLTDDAQQTLLKIVFFNKYKHNKLKLLEVYNFSLKFAICLIELNRLLTSKLAALSLGLYRRKYIKYNLLLLISI